MVSQGCRRCGGSQVAGAGEGVRGWMAAVAGEGACTAVSKAAR